MFLQKMHDTGLEHRTFNSHRSAISAFHKNRDQIASGKHLLVIKLMKDISNLRPPKPRCNFIWNKEQVLSYLKSLSLNQNWDLKKLSLKVTMLLVLEATKSGSDIEHRRFLVKSKEKFVFKITSKHHKQTNQYQI